MRWFKRKKKEDKLAALELVELTRTVLDILPTETGEIALEIRAHSVPAEEAERYAKKLDKVLSVRGKPDSGGTSQWIEWHKGRMSVTIFLRT